MTGAIGSVERPFEYQEKAVLAVIEEDGLSWKERIAQFEGFRGWLTYEQVKEMLDVITRECEKPWLRARAGLARGVLGGFALVQQRFVDCPIWQQRERINLLYGCYQDDVQTRAFLREVIEGDVSFYDSFGERLIAVECLSRLSLTAQVEETLCLAIRSDPSADVVKRAVEACVKHGPMGEQPRKALLELMMGDPEENNTVWYLVGSDLIEVAGETKDERFVEGILNMCSHYPEMIECGLDALEKVGVAKSERRLIAQRYKDVEGDGNEGVRATVGLAKGLLLVYGQARNRGSVRRRGQPYVLK